MTSYFDDLVAALKRDEGTGPVKNGRLMPYRDSKVILSIGYGRNLDSNGIRPQEAHEMLVHDIIEAQRGAQSLVPMWSVIDGVRQNVLSNMCFNLGVEKLGEFKLMLAAVNAKNYSEAARQMRNSLWFKEVGDRARRLADEMETGRVS